MIDQDVHVVNGDRRAGRRKRRGDLRGRPFPELTYATAAERRQTVQTLRAWAEQQAEDTVQWYMKDKELKRTGSRAVRALTILLAIAGAVVPLQSAVAGGRSSSLGYILLASAAGCAGFDYFFGLSAGWMRDIAAMQAMQRELTQFRLDWAALMLQAGSTAPAEELADPAVLRQLDLISRFVISIGRIVESETGEWLTDFRSSVRNLRDQTGVPWPGQ